MKLLEPWILGYLFNSLWQVPLVFCAAWLAARVARQAGPRLEHRVWVSALLLEVILPACAFHAGSLSQQTWSLVLWLRTGSAVNGMTRIVLEPARAAGVALPWLPPLVLVGIAIAYAGSVAYFAARLVWGVWKTEMLRRSATVVELVEDASGVMRRFAGLLRGDIEIATSPRVSGPAMVGAGRQTLLLPPDFLETLNAEDLHALLGHEMAHVRRHDFVKNLLYGVVSLPVAYHPLLWMTRARVAETRELICDAMAAEAIGGDGNYARSLLRIAGILSGLSGQVEARIAGAVGIFDTNNFERRIMRLTQRPLHISSARRAMIAAACILVAFSTCLSAMAWRMEVTAPEQKTVKRIAVADKNLTLTHRVDPVYPEEAKKQKLSGEVVLALHIGKDGVVGDIRVVKGPKVFQASALDAVKQWRYQPFLLNGDPIEVDTQVTVVFSAE